MKASVYETRVGSRAALCHHSFPAAERISNDPANIASTTQSLWMHAEKCIGTRGGHF
jgi:hypothetical protein